MKNKMKKLMHKFGVIPTVNEDALRNARPALAQAWRSFIDYNPETGYLLLLLSWVKCLKYII